MICLFNKISFQPRVPSRCQLTGDRATEKVSICACLLCAFPALRFAKCSLTVRTVQFRSPLAKIITTSKRKCARSCGVGDAVQGGGRCPKQYLSVLRGCISAHCANIQPHNLAFFRRSVAKRVLARFTSGQYSLMVGSLPSRALVQMSLRVDTLTPAILLIGNLQLISVIRLNNTKMLSMTNFALLYTTTIFCFYKNKKKPLTMRGGWSG